MKNKIKSILKYIYIFIILIIVYVLLGVITSKIPTKIIEENSKQSSEYLLGNHECADIIEKNTLYKKEYIFNYTNALMLNTAYSIDPEKPVQSFLLARKNYIPGTTEIFNTDTQYGLVSASNWSYQNQTGEYYYVTHKTENTVKESFEYARYWHGYLVILRPILTIFSYQTIEKLSIIFFSLLLGWCTYLICKKINKTTGILFLTAFIIMNSFYTAGSINEVTCLIIMLCSNIYILLRNKKIKQMPLVFFIIGSITNYFDLLTLPLITLAMPMAIYFLIREKEDTLEQKKAILTYIKLAIFWGLGYGLTWLAKWILVDLICNRNVLEVALKQILYRMSGNEGEQKFTYSYVLLNNLKFLGNETIYSTAVVSVLIMLVGILKNRKKIQKEKMNIEALKVYIITLILPFVWYFALKNHSAIHARFTHRLFIIFIFMFWILLAKIWGVDKRSKKE